MNEEIKKTVKKSGTKAKKQAVATKKQVKKTVDEAKKEIKKDVKTVKNKIEKKADTVKKDVKKTAIKAKRETLNKLNEIKQEVVSQMDSKLGLKECIYCHQHFDEDLYICPYCHRKQKVNRMPALLATLSALLLVAIIISYFTINVKPNIKDEEAYKESCAFVSYEELVRVPSNYKDKDVMVMGTVVSVEGYDYSAGNNMTLYVNLNMFGEETETLVTVNYLDKDYNEGFIKGDKITVYGVYKAINGNTPSIDAKYIVRES